MEQVIAERKGTPLTIESLLSSIGTDSFISFSQELFNGTSDLTSLPLSPTIKKYLKNLQQNIEIVRKKRIIIPHSMNTNKDLKNGKNQLQPHRREGI